MAEERYTVTFKKYKIKWHKVTFMLGPMTEEEYKIQDSIQLEGINKKSEERYAKKLCSHRICRFT